MQVVNKELILRESKDIIENGLTIQEVALKNNRSSQSVNKDIKVRLKEIDSKLYEETLVVLEKNKNNRLMKAVITEAYYIIDNNATLLETANALNTKKSTVYKHIMKYLPTYDIFLYRSVRIVINENNDDKAGRGGRANASKYKK